MNRETTRSEDNYLLTLNSVILSLNEGDLRATVADVTCEIARETAQAGKDTLPFNHALETRPPITRSS